jgi:hypothetical protein
MLDCLHKAVADDSRAPGERLADGIEHRLEQIVPVTNQLIFRVLDTVDLVPVHVMFRYSPGHPDWIQVGGLGSWEAIQCSVKNSLLSNIETQG